MGRTASLQAWRKMPHERGHYLESYNGTIFAGENPPGKDALWNIGLGAKNIFDTPVPYLGTKTEMEEAPHLKISPNILGGSCEVDQQVSAIATQAWGSELKSPATTEKF